MTDQTRDRLEGFFGFLILVGAVAYALLAGGCTAPGKPCISTLPTRAKIVSVAAPEKVPYLDKEAEEARVAIRITVDAESMSSFFNYMESLEAVARRALACVAR